MLEKETTVDPFSFDGFRKAINITLTFFLILEKCDKSQVIESIRKTITIYMLILAFNT